MPFTMSEAIVAALIGAAAVLIARQLDIWHERRTLKLDILRRLTANRDAMGSSEVPATSSMRDEFDRAVNEVFVVYRSRAVREALDAAYESVRRKTADRFDRMRQLYQAMGDEAGVKPDEFTERFFRQTFRTTP
jgi:hypothetical protein